MVISMRPGMYSAVKDILVPQGPQNPRSAPCDEAKFLGRDLVKVTCESSNIAQATTGAALARLHIERWQIAALLGSPLACYRTAPHWQPPLKFLYAMLENSPAVRHRSETGRTGNGCVGTGKARG